MASGFETRIKGKGRFHFGMMRNNYLKLLVNWVQDLYHISEEPNIKGVNQIVFLSHLGRALYRNEIRISIKVNALPESKKLFLVLPSWKDSGNRGKMLPPLLPLACI